MAIQSSKVVKALIAGGTIGGIVFGTLTFTGTTDLEAIKTAYNRALNNITTLTNNAEVYKTELARRLGLINDYKSKAESLQAKINDLEAQLNELREHGTANDDIVKQLQEEKAQLQAQLDDAVSEEDYKALTDEIERLQGELTKANNEVASLKDVVYPMYVPSDTYLTNKETIDTNNGKRIILTFTGSKPFTFVQENVTLTDVTLLIDGEFVLLNDVLGNVTANEVSWISNGVEYYITSDALSQNEMIEIAKSVGLLAVSK